MKKRLLSAFVVAALAATTLVGCGGSSSSDSADSSTASGEATYKAALLVAGTLGDKSFWDSANTGLEELKEESDGAFDFKVEQMGGGSNDEANYEPTILDYCDSGEYDVIITGSYTTVDALTTAIEEYPDQKFILFDEAFDFDSTDASNLFNMLFKQNEVSYLVGAEAAKMSETGKISFLGGMDGLVINDFLVGYIQGAVDTNPDIQVAVSMVGNYEDSAKGKDLSLAMYNAGCDCGFNVAGAAGVGLLEAANESGNIAFGVDSDQATLLPDYADSIPTSALKNVGNALKLALTDDMNGELEYGTQVSYGLAEDGVGLVEDSHYEEMVPEDIRTYVDDLAQQIKDGKITVKSSSDMTTDEIEELKASVAID